MWVQVRSLFRILILLFHSHVGVTKQRVASPRRVTELSPTHCSQWEPANVNSCLRLRHYLRSWPCVVLPASNGSVYVYYLMIYVYIYHLSYTDTFHVSEDYLPALQIKIPVEERPNVGLNSVPYGSSDRTPPFCSCWKTELRNTSMYKQKSRGKIWIKPFTIIHYNEYYHKLVLNK